MGCPPPEVGDPFLAMGGEGLIDATRIMLKALRARETGVDMEVLRYHGPAKRYE